MHHIQFPFHCLHDISNLDYTAYLNLFFISVVRLLFGKLPQNPSLKRCYSSALFRLCSVNWLLSIHPIIHQMKSVRKISRVIILKTTPWYFRVQQLDVKNMFRLIIYIIRNQMKLSDNQMFLKLGLVFGTLYILSPFI